MYIRIQNPAHELLCSFAACDSEVGSTHGLVPMAVKPFGAAVRRVETIDGADRLHRRHQRLRRLAHLPPG